MGNLPGDKIVVEGTRHPGDSDDEAQVEQQLERGRAAVRFRRVAARHRDVPRPDDHARSGGRRRGGHQWRKWRVPVSSIVPPAASTAATTSASRTDPPGCTNAVTPAARQTSTASGNG